MGLADRALGATFLVGVGVATVAVVIAAPRLLKAGRPLVREGLRRGMSLYERARSAAAEVTDDFEDLVAEVQSELAAKPADEANPAREAAAAQKAAP